MANKVEPKVTKQTIFNSTTMRDAFFYKVRQTIGQGILSAGTALYIAQKLDQGSPQVNTLIAVLAVAFLLYFTTKK